MHEGTARAVLVGTAGAIAALSFNKFAVENGVSAVDALGCALGIELAALMLAFWVMRSPQRA